jgi:hypothetical protein
LYSSLNIIEVDGMDRACSGHGHEMRPFFGKPEGKNHSEDLDIDDSIILKYILRK